MRFKSWPSVLGIVVAGVFSGLAVYFGALTDANVSASRQSAAVPRAPELVSRDNLAMRYARAVQDGNSDEVIRMTLWMNERLRHAKISSSNADVEESARAELEQAMVHRDTEHNVVRLEGIADQYVFVPGARLDYVREDGGVSDLEKEAASRTWIRVTFPSKSFAPLDESGKFIRSMEVGVNVSHDGFILKAGVIGNLDINQESFEYGWD